MSHFAKVENGIVTEVIVADQEVIDSGLFGDPSSWVQTSYNTLANVHYGPDRKPDGGVPLRGNYALMGSTYDQENDVFYAQPVFPSWKLNRTTWSWEAPTPYPADDKNYYWDEPTTSWVETNIK
jgi:hypothetical protein